MKPNSFILVNGLLALLTIAGIVSGAENRIIPVGYKACGPAGAECRFECLWDGQEHIAKKWCCSHAGYNTPQVHWGIMDLGNIYPITRIVVVHEGNLTDSKHLITEDYKLFGSAASMEGPWTLIKEFIDNTLPRNEILVPGVQFRYVGIEVSDPQVGAGVNGKQDDWVVRILELYIYSSAAQIAQTTPISPIRPVSTYSPFVKVADVTPVPTITPILSAAPATTTAATATPTPKPAKKLLYFFNPSLSFCKNIAEILEKPAVTKALSNFQMEYIQSGVNDPRYTQHRVYLVPTFLILDEQGKEINRNSSITTEADLLDFLKQ